MKVEPVTEKRCTGCSAWLGFCSRSSRPTAGCISADRPAAGHAVVQRRRTDVGRLRRTCASSRSCRPSRAFGHGDRMTPTGRSRRLPLSASLVPQREHFLPRLQPREQRLSWLGGARLRGPNRLRRRRRVPGTGLRLLGRDGSLTFFAARPDKAAPSVPDAALSAKRLGDRHSRYVEVELVQRAVRVPADGVRVV
jgi:hypothetical protein